ncbi:MAG: hypothetical protein ACYSUX_13805 [Planctomycetota bacterium]|jgi:hypothetical protein
MPAKSRIIVVSILILLGGALFAYCLFFYPIEIATPVQGGSTAAGLEAALVKKASTGAVEQDKSCQANQSRSEGRPRPKAGAT